MVGGLAVGVLAFTLTLEGATSLADKATRTESSRATADAAKVSDSKPMAAVTREQVQKEPGSEKAFEGVHVESGRLTAAQKQQIKLAPKVVVNPLDDEPSRMRARGELVGPWRPAMNRGGAAAGGCSFNIDCDDCDPCTTDNCNFTFGNPAGSGTCSNDPVANGAVGGCSDGLFANGIETCQSGVCELPGFGTGLSDDPDFQVPCAGECAGGTNIGERCTVGGPPSQCGGGGTCIAAIPDEDQNECVLPCDQRVCSDASTERGKPCSNDGQCPSGVCNTADQNCDNGLFCDGTETCNLTTKLCESSFDPINACGPLADCSETTCNGNLPGPPTVRRGCFTDVQCPNGPCQDNNLAGCFLGRCCTDAGGGEFTCQLTSKARCDVLLGTWFATAEGGVVAGNAPCPPCPKYGAGIAPFDPDDFVVTIGPVSDSVCGGLFDIGDDYEMTNHPDFIAVEQMVWVGGVETVAEERISFEFYDENTNLIEDTFFVSGSGIAVRVVEFDPPITIPSKGYVVARVANAFAPSGRIFWSTTTDDGDTTGVNDETVLWVNGNENTSNFVGECVGGTLDGSYCNPANGNADCDVPNPGTDGVCTLRDHTLAFELSGDKVPDPSGACCNKISGTCSQQLHWVCEANGGAFLGEGEPCPGTCGTGACCNTGTGACTITAGTCPGGTFQGFGTDCEPDCCLQPSFTGADNCNAATPIVITIPNVGDPGVRRTISGNNNAASGPDTCTAAQFDPLEAGTENADPGWWERIDLVGNCAYVTFDMCCSIPLHAPQWSIMWDGCPCEALGVKLIGSSENPTKEDLPANSRGFPYCDDDNLWWQFGPLRGGSLATPESYYQPIYSALAGAHGPYQFHVLVEACPVAACCFNACIGGANIGDICEVDGDCPGSTCEPDCELLNVLDCEDRDGTYLGRPFQATETTVCGTVCDTGSCCGPTPGVCEDSVPGPAPMTKNDCDILGGIYKGGIDCAGGVCSGGSRDGLSCNDNVDCPGGGTCTGTPDELAQPSPCPICDINEAAFCQLAPPEWEGFIYRNDPSVGGDDPAGLTRLADDFVALENGSVSKVCVLGTYYNGTGAGGSCFNLYASEPDMWTVSIYEDNGSLPGTLLGSRTGGQVSTLARGVEFVDTLTFHRHNLVLSPPISGLIAGRTYWLSVSNETLPEPENCDWWQLNSVIGDGNRYYISDYGLTFGPEDANSVTEGGSDLNFCINLQNEPPPEPLRPCCECNGTCTDTGYFECAYEKKGVWQFNETECAGFSCPAGSPSNDECASAITVVDGDNTVSNRCASDSGAPLGVSTDCGAATPTEFRQDTWYKYTATCDGQATISLCEVDNGIPDTLLHVYTNGTGTCPCPATAGNAIGQCSDDDCFWSGSTSSKTVTVTTGTCYLIRLGGFFDDDGAEAGPLTLEVSCGAPAEPDPPTALDAVCFNGATPTATPCGTNADCPVGQACRLKSRFLSINPADTAAAATPTALQVKVISVPGAPGAVNAAPYNYPAMVNDVWWVGAATNRVNDQSPYITAPLVCTGTPLVQDWNAVGNIHIYGDAIVPGATYEIRSCTTVSGPCSAPLVLATARHGDTRDAYNLTNFADISALVGEFQAPNAPSSLLKSHAWITPSNMTSAMGSPFGFNQISAGVTAFSGGAPPAPTLGANQCP